MGDEMSKDIFNYELETRYCGECKYHHWYYDENKKYGCPSERYSKICPSFRSHETEEKT